MAYLVHLLIKLDHQMKQNNLDKLQQIIKYSFKDKYLLIQSLTHKSYLNENRQLKLKSYERLEFLGDAILEQWASNTLFRLFPQFPEGKLTNLRALTVRTQTLSKVAKQIDLGQYIFLSQGEIQTGGQQNNSILEDVFEALIGAIYIDSGQKTVSAFLKKFLLPQIKILSKQKIYKDPKSIFQEVAQAKFNITPHYQTIAENGPDHAKTFTVAVYIGKHKISTGKGLSKLRAEEDASKKALKAIDKLQDNVKL